MGGGQRAGEEELEMPASIATSWAGAVTSVGGSRGPGSPFILAMEVLDR